MFHMAVDTLGHLLALHVTAADVGDREAVVRLAADIQGATGDAISSVHVGRGHINATPAQTAPVEGIKLDRQTA